VIKQTVTGMLLEKHKCPKQHGNGGSESSKQTHKIGGWTK